MKTNCRLIVACLSVVMFISAATAQQASSPVPAHAFSTAGFFAMPGSGREVFNFNVGWKFLKGSGPTGIERAEFDDKTWEVVALPHGLELLPAEASGCVNYQGPAWYRKHFKLDNALAGKRLILHFEAVMGKSKVFLDGKQIAEHFGGYLPIVIDLSAAGAVANKDHVIAVWADNSDDGTYPPGKPQTALDFAYFGGIYRDVWLVATSADTYITDAHLANKVAGGGVFVHFDGVNQDAATVLVDTDVANSTNAVRNVRVESILNDANGQPVGRVSSDVSIPAGATQTVKQTIKLAKPHVWHPDDPYLHRLESRVATTDGKSLDGYSQRIGVRSIEFRGAEGFFLNGKAFGDKLMGANHHQDFAYVGNAVPNATQWRDAKKLRDTGMRIIRAAHYPQDPAFMDACDELGLFIIVPTPGWQFWPREGAERFADLVVSDCQQMVRRDRNHASVIMWEPILNETGYPAEFATRTYNTVHAEYPYPGCYCAADGGRGAADLYDVIYGRGGGAGRGARAGAPDAAAGARGAGAPGAPVVKSNFTREWGDNVDDWNSHNSDSRVARGWGEEPMLIQARHYANPSVYAKPPYAGNSLNGFYLTPPQMVGGALWHSFDHQRGYHPDPFWGGIMDVFRQPKYSYFMFESNRDPAIKHPLATSGPMIFIAHELTPFSGQDITVFTNCDEVRLTIQNQEPIMKKIDHTQPGMPHPPVVFENVFGAQAFKTRAGRGGGNADQPSSGNYKVVAEGLINGQVVAKMEKNQAKRAEQILLSVDNDGLSLVADGSDFVPVIAEIADRNGNIRRLSDGEVYFTVEGEGSVMGDDSIGANPRRVEWGSAPALIRSSLKPGKIKVTAQLPYGGPNAPKPATIELTTVAPAQPLVYRDAQTPVAARSRMVPGTARPGATDDATIQQQLRQVERDQQNFAPN